MKRLLIVLAVGLATLGISGITTAGATSERQPITLVLDNECTGESVRMTAVEHIVVREGDHGSIFHLQWTSAKAIGLDSGIRYIVTGGPIHVVENVDEDHFVFTLTDKFNIVAPGSTDNLTIHFLFHATFVNGEVKVEREVERIECRG